MANVVKLKELHEDLADFIRDEEGIDVGSDSRDAEDFVKGFYKFIATQLREMHDNNGGKEDQIISIPGYVDFVLSYREGQDGNAGTFNISSTFDEEITKRIKNDAEA
jgi:hypothetical protein